jgi:hypothetical protein
MRNLCRFYSRDWSQSPSEPIRPKRTEKEKSKLWLPIDDGASVISGQAAFLPGSHQRQKEVFLGS